MNGEVSGRAILAKYLEATGPCYIDPRSVIAVVLPCGSPAFLHSMLRDHAGIAAFGHWSPVTEPWVYLRAGKRVWRYHWPKP